MKLQVVAAAATAFFGLASLGQAGTMAPTFNFAASLGSGGDAMQVSPELIPGPAGFTASGQLAAPSYLLDFSFDSLNGDPTISGSFTLTNTSSATQTYSVSATLGIVSIATQVHISGSLGDIVYKDRDENDAAGDGFLTFESSGGGNGFFYTAMINGTPVRVLGSFSNVLGPSTGGFTGTQPKEQFGGLPGDTWPDAMNTIGVSFTDFTLSAHDTVQAPFSFTVVPEPTFASLFALLGVIVVCRFAREKASTGARGPGRILPTGE